MILMGKIISRFKWECYELLEQVLGFIPGTVGYLVRRWFYGLNFKRIGVQARIGPGNHFTAPENMEIGDNFGLVRNSHMVANNGGRIEIGDGVSISTNVVIDAGDHGTIRIGSYTGIAPNCVMRSSAHNVSDPNLPFKNQGHIPGTIVIEEDVWLASSVLLLPGTHLGKGCVIGSGSVVSGVVKPYSILAGNPARVVGRRGAPKE